ncbi:7136_t:CDS:2, partial [Dentiscutata erythropus]
NKLKGINIDEFIQAIQMLVYDNFLEDQVEQEITELLLAIVWQQHQEHTQKFVYEMFLYQNWHIQDNKDIGLEKLYSVCSRFAYETYIKQQRDFVKSGKYGVLKCDDELLQCHYNDLSNLMQNVSKQILENGKIPKLQDNSNNLQQSTFEMTNVDNITNYKEIKMIESDKSDTSLHLFGLELNLRISQNAVLQ